MIAESVLETYVNVPRWDDPQLKAGAMVRGALWLAREIGEGHIFTKEQVRRTFPGISQIDRRIRDLRDYGWVIHTSSDDARLRIDEQRLVKIGVPVWDSKARRAAAPRASRPRNARLPWPPMTISAWFAVWLEVKATPTHLATRRYCRSAAVPCKHRTERPRISSSRSANVAGPA